jgi:hypothetical protein
MLISTVNDQHVHAKLSTCPPNLYGSRILGIREPAPARKLFAFLQVSTRCFTPCSRLALSGDLKWSESKPEGQIVHESIAIQEQSGLSRKFKWETGDFHDHIPGRTPQGRRATFLSGPPKVKRSSLQWSRKATWNRAKKRTGSQKISSRAFNLAVMLRWPEPKTAN